MMWLPTNQASAALFLHRNTLHKYRREDLFKAGTHWVRKGPWRNAGYLYDVDACKETFQQWAVDPPLRLQLINCTSCLLYTSPSPRDATLSRMPSSA